MSTRPKVKHPILTAQQRVALFALFGLCIFITFCSNRWPVRIEEAYIVNADALSAQLAALEVREIEAPGPEAASFTFNPNTVTKEELIRLGLSDRRADAWLKFRGNRDRAFRTPEDIRKLYTLPDELKDRLVRLAYVPDRPATSRATNNPLVVESFRFNPNSIGSKQLRRLGLSPRQTGAYLSYRAKIDQGFTYAGQLQRLPFLDSLQQTKLASLADFPEPPPPTLIASFTFDPNTISLDSLLLLGFPKSQAQGLLRYRAGRPVTFRKPQDLRRVRSLDSALVEAVLPLIRIAPPPPNAAPASAPKTYGNRAPPALASIDLNTADTTLLKTLPGIGSYRARRIIGYREALGGFYALSQLGRTRGVPDSVATAVLPYLTVSDDYRRINVNSADFDELNRHPNINRKQANAVIRYRDKHGPFTGPDDVRNIRLFTEPGLNGILPYLSYQTQ